MKRPAGIERGVAAMFATRAKAVTLKTMDVTVRFIDKKLMKHALLFVLFLIGFPCRSALQANQDTCPQGTPLPITQLGPKRSGPRWSFGSGSGIGDPFRVVIRNREAWAEMWKRIYNQQPAEEVLALLPEVDFSREMLIVVALGERPTSGYGIIIDRACEREKELEIVVRSISRVKCGAYPSVTQPFDVVRLPKRELSVVFREIEDHDCKY